ncbi:MAG: PAS domain S-box protein [Pontibacterium sp.]
MLKKLILTDILSSAIATVAGSTSVCDALRLMRERGGSTLIVTDQAAAVGIFSERELKSRRLTAEVAAAMSVSELMSSPVYSVTADTGLPAAIRIMDEADTRRLVVTDDQGVVLGLVTYQALASQLSKPQQTHLQDELKAMQQELDAVRSELSTERKLRRTEARLELILNTLPHGIQECDLNGCITFSNATHHRLLGLENGELTGRYIWDFQKDEQHKAALRSYLSCLVEEQSSPEPYRSVNITRDGREVMLEVVWGYQRNSRGAVTGFISVISDITALCQAEKALNDRQAELEQIFQALPVALVYADKSRRIMQVNPAFMRMFGYEAGAVLGEKTEMIYARSEDFYEQGQQRFNADAQDKLKPYKVEYRRKNGDLFVGKTVGTLVRDADGHVQGMLALITDISKQLHAQALISETEQKFRAIFNATFQLIGLLDPEGIVLEANEAALALGNLKMEEVVGKPLWEAYWWRGDKARIRQLRAAIKRAAAGEFVRYTVENKGLNGVEIIDFSLKPILDSQGRVKLLVPEGRIITQQRQAELLLRQSEERYRTVFNQQLQFMAVLSEEGYVLEINDLPLRMQGAKREDYVGKLFWQAPAWRDFPEWQTIWPERLRRVSSMQEPLVTEDIYQTKEGAVRYADASTMALRYQDGRLYGYLIQAVDTTERRQAESKLRLSARVLDSTAEGVIITDPDARIVEVNNAFSDITGYSRDEVIGHNPSLLSSGRQSRAFYQGMWKSLTETGQWRGELWNRHKDGSVFPEWININSVSDEQGQLTHYVAVFSDISRIKQSQAKLKHLAHHDALTNLPNRLLLNERLEQAIKHAERHGTQLAVFFLDLDNFKHINDSLGHPTGDQLLRKVADALLQRVRQTDTVARIGGDEFVLLLEDVGLAEKISLVAQKVLQAFQAPFSIEAHSIRMTASLGVCVYPQDGSEASVLLRNADSAMYRAKEDGRNTYQFYTKALTDNAVERVLLENHLHQAIDKGELRLCYQLQTDLKTGRIIGFEALLRWHHPQLGIIPPGKFIPLAEDSGLIYPIGEWVLQAACHQAKCWLDQGFDFGRIAVNVAGPQIQRRTLVNQVRETLARTNLPARYLELELTEGFIMQHARSSIEQLKALQALGVTLAIDDFGTGYSSLSYLKQLPIQKLKIDQSFVRDIPDDPESMSIADAVIALGKSLKLTVIAEGVETAEQAMFLEQSGCHEAQGYLYSKPVGPEVAERLLKKSGQT